MRGFANVTFLKKPRMFFWTNHRRWLLKTTHVGCQKPRTLHSCCFVVENWDSLTPRKITISFISCIYVRLFLQSSCCVQFVAHHRDCVVGGQGAPPGRCRWMIRRVRRTEPTHPLSARHGLHSPQFDTRQSISPIRKKQIVFKACKIYR